MRALLSHATYLSVNLPTTTCDPDFLIRKHNNRKQNQLPFGLTCPWSETFSSEESSVLCSSFLGLGEITPVKGNQQCLERQQRTDCVHSLTVPSPSVLIGAYGYKQPLNQ